MAISPPRLLSYELPKSATTYERALASQVDRLLELKNPIKDLWNPEKCPAALLPYLAWALSVDIWKTEWPEFKKRQIIADAIRLHRLKGTEEGLRRYVHQVDAEVLQVVTQPQDFYAAAEPTKDELDAYVRALPQLRLYTGQDKGHAFGLYADVGFADRDFATLDMGPALYGRRSVLFRRGVETSLKVVTIGQTTIEGVAVDIEQVQIPGQAGLGLFADVGFADVNYADAVAAEARVVTVTIDQSYNHTESDLRLSIVAPGYDPVNPRYERGSAKGKADFGFYADQSHADRRFAVADRSGDLVYDYLYLFDPSVVAPLGGPGGYADITRIGMPAFTAEVLVDAGRVSGRFESFADFSFCDQSFAVDDDLKKVDDVFEAINVSKSLTDTVLVSFQTSRQATFADGYDLLGGSMFGTRLARNL